MFDPSPAVVMGDRENHISQHLEVGEVLVRTAECRQCDEMRPRRAHDPLGRVSRVDNDARACVRARGLFPPMKAATDSKAAMLFFLLQRFFWRAPREWALCSLDPLLLVMDHCPWAASSVRRSFSSSGNSFLAFADLTSSFIRVKRIQRGARGMDSRMEGRRTGPGGMESTHPIIPYLTSEQKSNRGRKI